MKRFIGFIALFLLTTFLFPARNGQAFLGDTYTLASASQSPSVNLPPGTSLVEVVSATSRFNPRQGAASINYRVLGAPASELMITIYEAAATASNRLCHSRSNLRVGVIEGPRDRAPGQYTATWTGRVSNQAEGEILPANLYCYQLGYANAPIGIEPLREGLITLTEADVTGSGIPPSGGTGTPGVGPSTGSGSTQTPGSPSDPITVISVDPRVINPLASQGNAVFITYVVNQEIRPGIVFTLKIYDNAGFVVKDILALDIGISQGFRETVSWDGRFNNRQPVEPGDYYFKFRIDGQVVRQGLIRVEYAVTPPPPPPPPPPTRPDLEHSVDRTEIDPTTTPPQEATIRYRVNNRPLTGGLSVSIRDENNNIVRLLRSTSEDIAVAEYSVLWNGKFENGQLVPIATYRYVFSIPGTYREIAFGTITVRYSQQPPPSGIFIVSHSANPRVVDIGQPVTIAYTLGKNITNFRLSVRNSSGSLAEVLRTATNLSAGIQPEIIWNGKFTLSTSQLINAPVGLYNYVFEAANETPILGEFFVAAVGGGVCSPVFPPVTVSNLLAEPSNFYPGPNTPPVLLKFTLNQRAFVSVTITRLDGSLVKTLVTSQLFNSGVNSITWDATDFNSNRVAQASYYFRVNVSSESICPQQTFDSAIGLVTTIARQDFPPPPPPPPGDCGNFRDVPQTHYLCPAIEFVKSRGIFAGYGDGMLGIDRVIQRAEFLAVIQKAFRYPLETYDPHRDGNLGYRDLTTKTSAWYMPFLKTFANRNVMVGYPDKRMRPERTMITAEFFVSFVQAALNSPKKVTNFSLENIHFPKMPPFLDTPITHDTLWYMIYATFARINDLIVTERFYPARGITRGQVIQLVYDTHRKGLITYDGPVVASN